MHPFTGAHIHSPPKKAFHTLALALKLPACRAGSEWPGPRAGPGSGLHPATAAAGETDSDSDSETLQITSHGESDSEGTVTQIGLTEPESGGRGRLAGLAPGGTGKLEWPTGGSLGGL